MRALFMAAVVLLAAGTAGTAWAVTELRDGMSELPEHWWSSFPLVLTALGGMLGAMGWAATRPSRRPAKSP